MNKSKLPGRFEIDFNTLDETTTLKLIQYYLSCKEYDSNTSKSKNDFENVISKRIENKPLKELAKSVGLTYGKWLSEARKLYKNWFQGVS